MNPEERRRHPRKPVQDRAVLHRDGEGAQPALYGTALDISVSGMRLKLKQALDAGERVTVVIHLEGHPGSFRLSGKARWSAPLRQEKSFLLGIEIDEANDSRDLSAWQELFI